MKIIITTLLLAIALPVHGAVLDIASDRVLFMCAVETIECPKAEQIKFEPLEVALAPEPEILATSTSMDDRHIEQLKAIIVLLNDLLIRLKIQHESY
jgi:hypothetical protein